MLQVEISPRCRLLELKSDLEQSGLVETVSLSMKVDALRR
jgi:hypothetical protein